MLNANNYDKFHAQFSWAWKKFYNLDAWLTVNIVDFFAFHFKQTLFLSKLNKLIIEGDKKKTYFGIDLCLSFPVSH